MSPEGVTCQISPELSTMHRDLEDTFWVMLILLVIELYDLFNSCARRSNAPTPFSAMYNLT